MFELFRTHIRDYVSTAHGVTKDKLLLEISQIIYNIDCRYGRRYDFDALIGIKSPNARSILNYFHPDGRPEPVTKYKAIGTGSSYGLIYLKQNWHEDLTMEQVAELGYFIIKYIEKFNLDLTVGVGINKPQIWFIPDNKDDYCATPEQLTSFEKATQIWLKNVEQTQCLATPFKYGSLLN